MKIDILFSLSNVVSFIFQSIDMCKNEEIEYQLAAKSECFVWWDLLKFDQHMCLRAAVLAYGSSLMKIRIKLNSLRL